MGTGIGHYIPLVAYLGFWIAIVVSLCKSPIFGLYYMLPFLPYRTMRDHFLEWPLGGNVLTFLVVAVFIGALIHGKRMPKSRLYFVWFLFAGYLYLSMWLGTFQVNAPAPLWLNDDNFVSWKDYMLLPLIAVASGMVVEDRKQIRNLLIITAFSVAAIDRSSLLESLSRSWTTFDEDKRSGGPLGFGSNQTAAFLAQFAMLFWGLVQFIKRVKAKAALYTVIVATLAATMYCFSRAAYMAVVAAVCVLSLLKDRKLLIVLGICVLTWQTIIPTAVVQRVTMTRDDNGKLEASAQERVDLWTDAENIIQKYPIFGTGFGSYQFSEHVGNLKDTHNWYVKVLVETGVVGMLIVLYMLQQMYSLSWRLYRKAQDPLYKGLGFGLLLCIFTLMITNFFGDRWTYLEINGLLWALIGAAIRVDSQLGQTREQELEDQTEELSLAPVHAGA